jgi:hypothetical protein
LKITSVNSREDAERGKKNATEGLYFPRRPKRKKERDKKNEENRSFFGGG